MDYINFRLNDHSHTVDINYGSGLHKRVASKSPLERRFKFPLLGDISENPEYTREQILDA